MESVRVTEKRYLQFFSEELQAIHAKQLQGVSDLLEYLERLDSIDSWGDVAKKIKTNKARYVEAFHNVTQVHLKRTDLPRQ
jgi:hypothetical protein